MRVQFENDVRDCCDRLRRELDCVPLGQDPSLAALRKLPDLAFAVLSLFKDPALSAGDRHLVGRVLKYFVSPVDLMPELVYGFAGFEEDLVLTGLAMVRWKARYGEETLRHHGFPVDDAAFAQELEDAAQRLELNVRENLVHILEPDGLLGDKWLDDAESTEPEAKGESHVIVYAGPGTGKTYTLENELVRLLVEIKAPPESIVATTFTNKAADELRMRVRGALQDKQLPDVDRVLQRLFIGTIHSFCYSLISEFHYHLLSLKGSFFPMDQTRRMLYLFRRGIEPLVLQPSYGAWRSARAEAGCPTWKLGLFDFYEYAGRVYDFLSEEALGDRDGDLRAAYLRILGREAVSADEAIIKTYPAYWKDLQSAGYLDQSMILAYTEALLSDPHACAKVRAKIRHLLVDEYQDTNPIQDRIFRRIASDTGRVFAVGDDDQSIYGFRGADIRNIKGFTKNYLGATQKELRENRRSTQNILTATQSFIGQNKDRVPKDLMTKNEPGAPVLVIEAPFESLPETLAACLNELKTLGKIKKWDEVALLLRGMNKRAREYEEALTNAEIPVRKSHGKAFMKEPLPKAILAILEMIGGDEVAITTRKRAYKPFFEAMELAEKTEAIEKINGWNRKLKEKSYSSLVDLYYAILNDTDAITRPSLLPTLGRFSALLSEAEEELRSPNLEKRLDYFLKFAHAAEGAVEGPMDDPEEGVQLMTIHRAKGLQFPVVVIGDAAEGSLPFHFNESPRDHIMRVLTGKKAESDSLEEERRVLYVGMTRAQHLLLFTAPTEAPSRFLEEIPARKSSVAGLPSLLKGTDFPRPAQHAKMPPLHVSHSHLFNYQSCPKRYDLENRCEFAGQAIAPLRKGKSLHTALEILHRLWRDGAKPDADGWKRILERSWYSPLDTEDAANEFSEIRCIFESYARRMQAMKDFRVEDVERPFYVAEKDGVLTGKIDLVRRVNGRLEIVELKFNENPLRKEYPFRQLNYYRLAFPDETPGLVACFLKDDREVTAVERPPGEVRQEIADIFARIRGGDFAAKPEGEKCRICPVRLACSDVEPPRNERKGRALSR